ncbi:MAG: hypothetical protein LBT51_08995 [Fusobacteriaceae bacterium]|jgi:hypothetical protein|nr:hypothetical protein [Fusobacteriaceae bacterium]
MRSYDKNLDDYYSPDDTPELYLTEEQIDNTLNAIPDYDDPAEIEVKKTIKIIETINREEKFGKISKEDCITKSNKVSDDFLEKYGFWPYITKTFEEFYKLFEK